MPAPAALALLLALLAPSDPPAPDPDLTDLDRRSLAVLPAVHDHPPLRVHFDPADLTEGWAAWEGRRALEALRRIEATLEIRFEGRAHLFLYRDEEAFRAATGAPREWGGFASGPRSIHVPRGAPLLHEMTHLAAHAIPGAAGGDPGDLLREGLAAALEGEDHGVPVHSWAAVYLRLGLLPSLAALRRPWPGGPPSGAHPYHAAGSFVARLLETEGATKVKALYAAPDRPEEAVGRGWDALEEEWRTALLARSVTAPEEAVVRRSLGLPGGRLPEVLAAARGEALLPGAPARGWVARRAGAWAALEDGTLRGEGTEGWAVLETERNLPAGTALRVRVRVLGAASLLLRVNRREGVADEALLTPGGSHLTLSGGEEGFLRSPVRLLPGRWSDLLLLDEGGAARLYLDGRLLLEAPGGFRGGGGAFGLGVSGGAAEFAAVEAVAVPAGARSGGE